MGTQPKTKKSALPKPLPVFDAEEDDVPTERSLSFSTPRGCINPEEVHPDEGYWSIEK